ncbi:GNAT family N-acetyltransferase [Candidatus Bipolaricaulota bacterium]|nr:GNAT family N-acetyltransferase [Candidatus Bipolaricaulota bacterium]
MQPVKKLGYTSRPARWDDVEAAVELFNACSQHMFRRNQSTVNEVRTEWGTPGFDLEADTQLVFHGDRLVGYVECWNPTAPYVRPMFWGRVHPTHRGRGVGSALVNWAEERAQRSLALAPPEAQVTLGQGVWEQDQAAHALLLAHGYTVARRFFRMKTAFNGAIPEPAWPEGITVRTFDPERDLEAVVRAVDDAFQDHWGHVPGPVEQRLPLWRQWISDDAEFDPTLWFLAVDRDEIVGVSLCRRTDAEDPDQGWVNTLGVRRPWRRRGIALALLYHSFRELRARGRTGVGLGVDATSLTGADRVYARAGMWPERVSMTMEKVLRPGVDLRRTAL